MKSRAGRTLLGLFVALVILCIALALLTIGARPPQEETGASSVDTALSQSSEISVQRREDLLSMKVTNQQGSYTILSVTASGSDTDDSEQVLASGEMQQDGVLADGTIVYQVQELEGLPQNETLVSQVMQYGAEMNITEEVGETDDLDQFGLASPQATVTLTYEDGESFTYYVGDQPPVEYEEPQYYLVAEDSNYVYIGSVDNRLLGDVCALVDTQILEEESEESQEEGEETGASGAMNWLRLSGGAFEQDILITHDTAGNLQIEQPLAAPGNQEAVNYIAASLSGLKAQNVVAVHPDSEQLEEFGLAQPQAVLECEYNGKEVCLEASPKDEASYYLQVADRPVVYQVSADRVKAWAQADLLSLRNEQALVVSQDKIADLELTVQGQYLTFTATREEDPSRSTQDKTYYTYTLWAQTPQGQQADAEDYAYLLERLNELPLVGWPDGGAFPEGEVALCVTYSGFDGQGGHTLELIPGGEGGRYAVRLDGIYQGLTPGSSAKAAVEAAQALAETE